MRPGVQKGRGAISNRTGRFEALAVEAVDDGWGIADEALPPLADDGAARAAALGHHEEQLA